MNCKKKKLDKIKAMLIISNSSKENHNHNRQEIRIYWCDECKSYHTTKRKLTT